jgi:hypothetical protein
MHPDRRAARGNRQGSIGQGHQVTIAEQAEHWITPHGMSNRDAKDGDCRNADVPTNSLLGREAARWPTPTESTATIEDLQQARYAHNNPNRPAYSECWPTPIASDANGIRTPDGKRSMGLNTIACHNSPPDLQTPAGPPSSPPGPISPQPCRRSRPRVRLRELSRESGRLVFRAADAGSSAKNWQPESLWLSLRESRGRTKLCCRFVEWLMGLPPGHTET